MTRPPLPPFTQETAIQKARLAEDAWNSRDPARVALAYTPDSRWRNRSTFLQRRVAIEDLLTQKWPRESDYRLVKEMWAFDAEGLMHTRIASIHGLAVTEAERLFHWPSGRRPDDHPGLTELGL